MLIMIKTTSKQDTQPDINQMLKPIQQRFNLNSKGFSHDFLLIFILLVCAIVGVGYMVVSHADPVTPPPVPNSLSPTALPSRPLISNPLPNQTDNDFHSDAVSNNSSLSLPAHTDVNWAGFVDPGVYGEFTSVQGQITVPKVTCSNAGPTQIAVWVGLEGATKNDDALEQDGLIVNCTPHAQPAYWTFTEMIPKAEKINYKVLVEPGDQLYMRVWYNEGNGYYALQLINETTKHSNVIYERCASSECKNNSAEWIVERPTNVFNGDWCVQYPFIKFGSIGFSRAETSDDDAYHMQDYSNLRNYPLNVVQWIPSRKISQVVASPSSYPMPRNFNIFSVVLNSVGTTTEAKCSGL